MNLLARDEAAAIEQHLQSALTAPVSLDLWTRAQSVLVRSDRDPCAHCDDVVDLARRVASLHPAVSLTLYDMERHADRASEAGVERPPLTVIRSGGRAVRFLGLWGGALLPAFIDAMVMVAAGSAPLPDATREALDGLTAEADVEVLVAPYDQYSAPMMRMAMAFGVESRRLRVQATEIAEFPLLAAARGVTELPVVLVNGRRFVGAWEPDELLEQIRRVAAGDAAPVIRDRVPVTPFLTEEEARRMAEGQAGPQPPSAPGGLLLPGR